MGVAMREQGFFWNSTRVVLGSVILFLAANVMEPAAARAGEPLIIAASPSLKGVLEQLATGFERSHPDVRVKLHFNTGLAMRQGIAGMQNSMVGRYFIESGPIHLVAPGGDELIARLEMKYYVLPGTTRSYIVGGSAGIPGGLESDSRPLGGRRAGSHLPRETNAASAPLAGTGLFL